jgi:hypothetical protein
MDVSCFPLKRVQRVLIWVSLNPFQRLTISIRHKLGLAQSYSTKTRSIRHNLGFGEPYLAESKIHPSQIRTRWTLFNGKQTDESCFPLKRVQRVLICDGWILFSVKWGCTSLNLWRMDLLFRWKGFIESLFVTDGSCFSLKKTRYIHHKLGLA